MSRNDSKQEISSLKKVKEVCFLLFGGAAKRFPLFFIIETIYTLLDVLNPFINLILTPLIIDELLGGMRMKVLMTYAIILVLGKSMTFVLMDLCRSSLEKYQERLNNFYSMEISRHAMCLDFELTEDKKCLEQLEKAKTGMSWYSGGAYGMAQQVFLFLGNILKIVGFVTIIVRYAPLLLILVIAYVIINGLLSAKNNKIEIKCYGQLAKINRIFSYFGWEIVDFRYGKDVRLYEAQDMLVEKWDTTTDESVGTWRYQTNTQLPIHLWMNVMALLRNFITYFWGGVLAVKGIITIGSATQLIEAASSLDSTLGGLVWNIQELIKRSNYAYEYVLFAKYPERMTKGTRKVREGLHEIEFKNVSFSYPGTKNKILDDINIKIVPREKLSIVGLNGAGKTTFIKLLCRLYDPTEGVILLDGTDIREYDLSSYVMQFAPVFQDFKMFSFSIEENIAADDEKTLTDDEKKRCMDVVKKLELEKFLDKLPNGINTKITKIFDEAGVEPSGGEQQKLALARALYKDSPVLILDEPTAALDPIAEYEIYRQFNELVENKTAFYISHRLSSCKFCDYIAVFSGGKIAEYGTHDELVAINDGIYAGMFEAQAQYYR